MERSLKSAEKARVKEQRRQAKYYNRRGRQQHVFRPGDRVWVLNPPRGPKATKFVHLWMGPMRIVEDAGYNNFLLAREDTTGPPEMIIAHVSFSFELSLSHATIATSCRRHLTATTG